MPVYSSFGCSLAVLADCGEHRLPEFPSPVRLIRARRADDGAVRHYLYHTLRAEGGLVALDRIIDVAPKVALAPAELAAAIEEAS